MTLLDRLPTTLMVLVTTIGATVTVLVAGGSGPLELHRIRLTYDLMAALALIPWLILAVFRPGWRPSSRLAPAIVACLAVFTVSTVTSREPRLSVEMLGYAILLAELYLLLVALLRRPPLRLHLERMALVMCVLVCVLYLIQAFQAWFVWWDAVGRIAIPPLRPGYLGLSLGAPIPLATLVLLLGTFGLATSQLRGRTGRAAIVVVLILVAATVLVTASRGAWLGTAAGLAVTFAAVAARPEARESALRRLRSRWTAVAVLVGILMLVAGGRLAALSGRLTLEDPGYRAGFADASLRMFGASPLSGSGPGTWQVLRAANADPTAPDLYIPHAHNLYLQTLAEFGLVGVVAGVVFVGAVGLLIARAVRSDHDMRQRVGYAALFGVVLLAVQQVGDLLVNVPALLFAMALPVAWLDAAAQPRLADLNENGRDHVRRPMGLLPMAAAVVTCAIFLGLARIEAITDSADRGVSAANDGRWAEATIAFGQAVAADPAMSVYQFQLGVSAANVGDLRTAESALATSAAADDYTYAWLNLAAVRWQRGDLSGARDALARAERLGLQRTPVAIAAGWLHQQLGDEQAAIEDYATAVAQDPTLADDPFWASSSGPPGGLGAILRIVEPRVGPTTRLQIDLVLGRFDRARVEAATLSGQDLALYSLVVPAWEGDPSAWLALQAEAARRPLDPAPAVWARIVAAHLGDHVGLERYGRWLNVLDAGYGGPDVVARIALGSPQLIASNFLDRYGSLYRRQVLGAQVVRLLPQMVLQDHP